MAGPNLQINIGANVAAAVAGLNNVGAAANTASAGLNNTGTAAANAGRGLNNLAPLTRPSLQGLTLLGNAANNTAAGLGATAPAAAAAGRGLGQAANGANQAGAALTNVGRVAQDLPFGFVGIQNNLNPLLESFQRLRAATGSNAAAFRALLSSLVGAGGIGLALSVVSSAIVIFQNGIAGFNRKTKQAKESADELTKALEATRAAADVEFGAIGGIQGQIFQVQELARAVRDETLSQKERGNALERLQGISKDYFGNIKLTKESLEGLTAVTNQYVEALTRQAIVQELSSEIGKIGAAYLKQRQAVEQLRGTIKQFITDKGLETKFDANGRAIFDFSQDNKIAQGQLRTLNRELKVQEDALQPLQNRFGELRNALDDATLSLLGFKKTSGGGQDKKDIDLLKQRIDALKELRDSIGLSTIQQRELVRLEVQLLQRDGIKLGFTPQEVADRVDALIQSTRFGEAIGAVPINVPLLLRPNVQIDIAGAVLPGGAIPEGAFDGVINAIRDNAAIRLSRLREQLAEGMRNAVFNGFVDGLVGVGEAVGNIITGIFSGNIGSALAAAGQTLLNTIGGVLQDIGKQIIVTSTLVQTLKKVLAGLFSNPAGGIAVGIALVALGQVLKSIKFDVPGFATGITSFAGGMAMVGENGPELVRLPAGSDVIPNSRIGEFNSGQVFIATSVLRGNDIYTSYNRTRNTRRRI